MMFFHNHQIPLAVSNFLRSLAVMAVLMFFMFAVYCVVYKEGDYFPVVKDFVIVEKDISKNGDVIYITAEVEKLRDCKLEDAYVFLEDEKGILYKVSFASLGEFGRPPLYLPDGPGHWNLRFEVYRPNFVRLTNDNINNFRFHITYYHNCWGIYLWKTKTSLYTQYSH